MTVHVTQLGLSHATAHRDAETGVCTVSLGTVNHRVVLSDDPGVLMTLLTDGLEQLRAIFDQ
jgi:hypothetical protein